MSEHDKGPGASGAAKMMAILKVYTGDRAELSLTDICDRTGLSSSTAHRWLRDLVNQGALVRSPAGLYSVSRLIWEIGTRCQRAAMLREAAMPSLQELFQATRGHAQLAMPAGDEALLVERLSKNLPIQPVARVGGRLPLHATGVGKAILAWSSPGVRRRALSRALVAYTPHTITSPRLLRAELELIRERGYATCHEERTIGLDSYAVPIFPNGGATPVAAVSVLVEAGHKEAGGLLKTLDAAARQIARALHRAHHQPFGAI